MRKNMSRDDQLSGNFQTIQIMFALLEVFYCIENRKNINVKKRRKRVCEILSIAIQN